jgi:hemoglobin-like flavoprotein
MTPRQIDLVQTSFLRLNTNHEKVADLFYTRLFDVTPGVRTLFPADMAAQKRKLMEMLESAIANLHQIHSVMPAMRDLGRRHVRYGVTVSHYALVGGALLWAIERELGEEFTPEMRAAWTEVYTALAGAMNGTT